MLKSCEVFYLFSFFYIFKTRVNKYRNFDNQEFYLSNFVHFDLFVYKKKRNNVIIGQTLDLDFRNNHQNVVVDDHYDLMLLIKHFHLQLMLNEVLFDE